MKTNLKLLLVAAALLLGNVASAQDEIQTVFGKGKPVGGYGAISNKFTSIGSGFANMTEVYGGIYLNKKLMIGASAAGTTNYISVPSQYSIDPLKRMSYEYGQVGMITEYVMRSNKSIHVVFSMFGGAGFTMQYERPEWYHDNYNDNYDYSAGSEDVFFVAEPGVQLEVNVFKWMRFSPGISYRTTFGSTAAGLSDADLSKISYNATLKFGKF